MQSMSLLEGKTTELKQLLKKMNITLKIANKNVEFLFVLSIVIIGLQGLSLFVLCLLITYIVEPHSSIFGSKFRP